MKDIFSKIDFSETIREIDYKVRNLLFFNLYIF